MGITHTRVKPPANAAREPVCNVSLSSRPGSRKWTCTSQNPWVITRPEQSILVSPFAPPVEPTDLILFRSITTLPFLDLPDNGSRIVPPCSTSFFGSFFKFIYYSIIFWFSA